MNTKISYLYRDASNYKAHNEVIVAGPMNQEDIDTIMDSLDEGEYFIPNAVGMPEKKFEKQTRDDHPYFELDTDGFDPTEEIADENWDFNGTGVIHAAELVQRFAAMKGQWAQYA